MKVRSLILALLIVFSASAMAQSDPCTTKVYREVSAKDLVDYAAASDVVQATDDVSMFKLLWYIDNEIDSDNVKTATTTETYLGIEVTLAPNSDGKTYTATCGAKAHAVNEDFTTALYDALVLGPAVLVSGYNGPSSWASKKADIIKAVWEHTKITNAVDGCEQAIEQQKQQQQQQHQQQQQSQQKNYRYPSFVNKPCGRTVDNVTYSANEEIVQAYYEMDEAITYCFNQYGGRFTMKKNIGKDLTIDFKGWFNKKVADRYGNKTTGCDEMLQIVDSWNSKVKRLQKPKDPDTNFQPLHPITIALTIKQIIEVGNAVIASHTTTDVIDEARRSYLIALESYFANNYASLLVRYEGAKKAINNQYLIDRSLANYVRDSNAEIEISEDADRTFRRLETSDDELSELAKHIKKEKVWDLVYTPVCE